MILINDFPIDATDGERLIDVIELLCDLGSSPLPLRDQLLDLAATRANQRKLGGDEEAVHQHEQEGLRRCSFTEHVRSYGDAPGEVSAKGSVRSHS